MLNQLFAAGDTAASQTNLLARIPNPQSGFSNHLAHFSPSPPLEERVGERKPPTQRHRPTVSLRVKKDERILAFSSNNSRLQTRNSKPETEATSLTIDWVGITGTLTNYIFQSDQEYFISGIVNLVNTGGESTVIEGGAILKFTNSSSAKDRSVPGDNLFGHELWQFANQNELGLAKARNVGAPSRNNPVIALTKSVHKLINDEQRALNARAMTPLENIRANAAIMRRLNSAPPEKIDNLEKLAIQHAKSLEGTHWGHI